MKNTIRKQVNRLLVLSLVLGLSQCKKTDVDSNGTGGIVITDPNELSKVMIIPGATLEKGTPPPITNTSDTPRLSTPSPEVSTISGQDATFSIDYSNAIGNITIIYIQFEGADSYFKIPISGTSGINGRITIPMRIPDNYVVTPAPNGKSSGKFCCFAASAKGTRQASLCNNNFTSNLPPRPGQGKATIGGQSYDATAACDLDFAPYGRGYGILIGQKQALILYNMRQGSNSIGNFENLVGNSSTGIPTTPFALYSDGSSVYFSTSGTATTSGKTVSASVILKELGTSRQITLSASGNCQ